MAKTYATVGDIEVLQNELERLRKIMISMSEVQREGLQVSERLNRRIGELEQDKLDEINRRKTNFFPW